MKTHLLLNSAGLLSLLLVFQMNSFAQAQWVLDTTLNVGGHPSGIAITPDNSKVVVSNKTNPGTVKIISTTSYTMANINYAADPYPNGVAIHPNGLTAVVNTMHHTVYIDLSSKTVSGFFAAPCVGTTLYGISINTGSTIYPDLSSGCTQQGLRFINPVPPSSSSTFTQISSPGVLYGIALNGNSALVTANSTGPAVNVNLSTAATQNITGMTMSYGVATLHNTAEALVYDGDSIVRISLSLNKITKKITDLTFNTSFQNIAITSDDKYAFVIGAFDKKVIDLSNNSVIQTFSSGQTNVATMSDGSKFFVTDDYNGQLRVYKKMTPVNVTGYTADNESHVLFPNPSTGRFSVVDIENVTAIDIYDVGGKCVSHMNSSQLREKYIDLSHLSKGIYFAKVYSEQTIHFERIIIE